jgi:hypothetical protein
MSRRATKAAESSFWSCRTGAAVDAAPADVGTPGIALFPVVAVVTAWPRLSRYVMDIRLTTVHRKTPVAIDGRWTKL